MTASIRLGVSALSLAVLICAATPSSANLLTDGGFETAGGIPDWTLEESIFDQTTMMRRDFGNVNSAEQIGFGPQGGALDLWLRAFVGGMGAGPDNLTNATLSQVVPVTAGDSYTFSGYSRYETNYAFEGASLDPTGPLGAGFSPTKNTFELAFLDGGGAVIGTPTTLDVTADRISQSILPNLDDWLQHTIAGVTAPAGAVSARVSADAEAMLWNGGGVESAFYDTFSFTNDSDPSTELLLNEGLEDEPGEFNSVWDIIEDPGDGADVPGGPTIQSAPFANNPATGGSSGVWFRAFEGGAVDTAGAIISQTVPGVAGGDYTFTLSSLFEGAYSGGIPSEPTTTTAEIEFLDGGGAEISSIILDIAADRDTQSGGNANDSVWYDHTVNGVAPAGTASIRVLASAQDMVRQPMGGQSAFVDDFSLVLNTPPLVPGDTDGDGDVDLVDLDNLGANFGLMMGATVAEGDFDGDGDVDLVDLDTLGANFGFGTATAVPEPSGMLLVASLATATLLGRRRQ